MSKLIRISGAHKERIDGVGTTIRGEPFDVKSKDLYDAMVGQENRFVKPSKKKED